jgi:NADH-quinone oxidoreductase subunit G
MCDYGRLNFDYVGSEKRLLEPMVLEPDHKLTACDWKTATSQAALQLRHFGGWEIAIIASGRMTNEELWLTSQIARILSANYVDIVPRSGPSDNILLSADRNPNVNGARLLLGLTNAPGANLPAVREGVASGQIKALLCLGEDPLEFGLTKEQLKKMPALVLMNISESELTSFATALLPSASFAEKRGSMINGSGRLQRLNRAVRPPGQARDDWEILRDLQQALTGSNGLYTIDDVFRQMSEAIYAFSGLTLNKIGDLGVPVLAEHELVPPSPETTFEHDIEEATAKEPPGRGPR